MIEKLTSALEKRASGNRNDKNGGEMKALSDKLDKALTRFETLESQFRHS